MHGRKLGTHLGVNLKTEEDRRMHELLQSDGAMLDWIAVPHFLDALQMTELPKPDYARNMRIVGHTDQGGRPDGVQVMVHRGFAYVGHMFSKGFSVIDVRDPKNPRAVNYLAAPPNTWNIHLQVHDDLLLVINAKDMFAAAEFADETRLLQRRTRQDRRHRAKPSARATGPRGLRSTTSPSRRRRAASASCRSRAAASIASGTPAGAGPTPRRCSTASPTTSS